MANLIEYIQSQVYENSTEDISGSIMQQVLTRMASDEGVVNVHTISGQTPFADYNNAQAARDAVPAGFKKLGLIITYKLSSGWYIDEFIGSATSGWSTASNWKCLGPISVSQNASTGKTTITVGSDSYDVATEPVSVSQNTQSGETLANIKIGNTNHIIKAEEKDTTPIQNSTKPITSGAVYDLGNSVYNQLKPELTQEIEDAVGQIQPIVIEGDVSNAPDEEDLTSEQQGGTNVLKFKNKDYAPLLNSGLGRVYLRKNIVGDRNLLTQDMINKANTIYHIQYDYEINKDTSLHNVNFDYVNKTTIDGVDYYYEPIILEAGDKLVLVDIENCVLLSDLTTLLDANYYTATEATTIYIATSNESYGLYNDVFRIDNVLFFPNGCVLVFDGGSLKNGEIVGNGVDIESSSPCFHNCIIAGIKKYKSHWFVNLFAQSIRTNNNPIDIFQTSDIVISSSSGSIILPNNSVFHGDKKYKVFCADITDGIHLGDGCKIANTVFYGQGSVLDIESSYAPYAMACSSSNVIIDNCEFYNFYSDACYVIHFRRGGTHSNITIKNCLFDGFGAKPNGVVGDTSGSCRAINIQGDYSKINILNNIFKNIHGNEDSDYICINKESIIDAEHLYYESIDTVIKGNTFFELNQAAVKIFGSDATIKDNIVNTTYSSRGVFRAYNSKNIIIADNCIKTGGFTLINLGGCSNCNVINLNGFVTFSDPNGGSFVLNFNNSSDIYLVKSYIDFDYNSQTPLSYNRSAMINVSGMGGVLNIIDSDLTANGLLYGIIGYTNQTPDLKINIKNSNITIDLDTTALDFGYISLFQGESGTTVNITNSVLSGSGDAPSKLDNLNVESSYVRGALRIYSKCYIRNSKMSRILSNGGLYAENLSFDDYEVASAKLVLYTTSEIHNVIYKGTYDTHNCRLLDLRNFDATKTVTISGFIGRDVKDKTIANIVYQNINKDRVIFLPYDLNAGLFQGSRSVRPSNPAPGTVYFDQSIMEPLYYGGSIWIDSNGQLPHKHSGLFANKPTASSQTELDYLVGFPYFATDKGTFGLQIYGAKDGNNLIWIDGAGNVIN